MALWVVWSAFILTLFLSPRQELLRHGPRLLDSLTNVLLLGLILAIVYSLGRILFSFLLPASSSPPAEPYYPFCIGLGVAALSILMFILGALKLYYSMTGYIILALGSLLVLRRLSRAKILRPTSAASEPFSFFEGAVLLLMATTLLLALGCALVPPFLGDDMVYHLNTPKIYLKSHGLTEVPNNVYTYFPMGMEMTYVLAMLVKGDILAKLIHWSMGVFITVSIFSFARRIGLLRSQALLAAATFCTVPTVWFLMAWSAYIDLALTFFIMLTVFALLNSYTHKDHRWLIVGGVLFGFALSIKFTSLYLFPVLFFGLILRFRSLWADGARDARLLLRPIVKEVLFPMMLALLVATPWYLKNIYYTGNPFFPFFLNLFPVQHPGWDTERAALYLTWLGRYGSEVKSLGDYLRLPWSLTMKADFINPRAYDGVLGPMFLMTLPAFFLQRRLSLIAKVLLVFSFIYFLIWAFSSQQMRFLVPMLPFLSLLAGWSLAAERPTGAGAARPKGAHLKTALMGFLLIALLGNFTLLTHYFVRVDPLPYLGGFENRDEYLTKLLDYYELYQYINTKLPETSKVFMIDMGNFGYYLERDYFSDSIFEDHTMETILNQSATSDDVLRGLVARGFTHLLYQENFMLSKQYTPFTEEARQRFVDFLQRYGRVVRSDKNFRLVEIRSKG
jgi:hypothetical protein